MSSKGQEAALVDQATLLQEVRKLRGELDELRRLQSSGTEQSRGTLLPQPSPTLSSNTSHHGAEDTSPPRRLRFSSQAAADGVETLSASRLRRRRPSGDISSGSGFHGAPAPSGVTPRAQRLLPASDLGPDLLDTHVPLRRQGVQEQLQALDEVRGQLLALRASVHGELERQAEVVRDLGAAVELQVEAADGVGAVEDAEEEGGTKLGSSPATGHREQAAQEARLRRAWSQPAFRPRASLLTTMLEGRRDYRTIYSMAVAGMAWLGINLVVQAAFQLQRRAESPGEADQGWACGGSGQAWAAHAEHAEGIAVGPSSWSSVASQLTAVPVEPDLTPDIGLLLWGFGRVGVVVPCWVLQFVLSFFPVLLVQGARRFRWSWRVWLPLYCLGQGLQVLVPTAVVWYHLAWSPESAPLPPPSAVIIQAEMARFLMKAHAYFREKMLYGLHPDSELARFIPSWARRRGVTEAHVLVPRIDVGDYQREVGRYIYFSFAPTLVYRDRYPVLGPDVRWVQAGKHGLNFLLVVGFVYLLFVVAVAPQFKHTALYPGDLQAFVLSVFHSMLPASLLLVLMFYGVLHSWLNMWAELLRFGDRGQFASDWWNAASFG